MRKGAILLQDVGDGKGVLVILSVSRFAPFTINALDNSCSKDVERIIDISEKNSI